MDQRIHEVYMGKGINTFMRCRCVEGSLLLMFNSVTWHLTSCDVKSVWRASKNFVRSNMEEPGN